MDIEKALEIQSFLDGNESIQRFFAQAKSRYILLNVDESSEKFPPYASDLTTRIEHTAFAYLGIGCFFAEQDNLNNALQSLAMGASLLEFNHKPKSNRSDTSTYYLLACSLAYYSCREYSKAFVVLNEVEFESITGKMLSLFLKKRFDELLIVLNEVMFDDSYDQDLVSGSNDEEQNLLIYTKLISTSLSNVLDFLYNGNEESKALGLENLNDLITLLEIDEEPSLWWCMRLLRIIVRGLDTSSLWNILPPLLPSENFSDVKKYIKALSIKRPTPVVELFISQKGALTQSLDSTGAVICLPTSSGKTRVAEITIFKCLLENPEAIVLYIAPFRSLAFEIESTLESTFNKLNIGVSHLYGGGQFGKIDKIQIENSRIIIATPEKAKAIVRSDETFASKIKLVILDEGHLLGNDDRLIRNEVFFEELRYHVEENNGKFLILSAVLPNAKDIAEWLTGGTHEKVYSNPWKPSTRRIGVLEFKNNNVNINWKNEKPETWNNGFIKTANGGPELPLIDSKRKAVAATAVRLSNIGSVLIFHSKSVVIRAQAKECLEYMGVNAQPHQWNNLRAWESFKLVITHTLGENCELLRYAEFGILYHYSNLPSEVRSALDHLMRNSNPKIIISTTTLAQGVNIGVSTVIIADVWYKAPGGSKVSYSDFWNIAGRAGRAFVDSEGKVLFAIDQTGSNHQNSSEKKLANEYLNNEILNKAQSGLLCMIQDIYSISKKYGVDFELLIELVGDDYDVEETFMSEDDLTLIHDKLDLLDDTLLALSDKKMSWLGDDPSNWIDSFFRKSLAYIQASHFGKVNPDNIIQYLKKRNQAVLGMAGEPSNWKGYISTGIPLRASLRLGNLMNEFKEIFTNYENSDKSTSSLVVALMQIELLVNLLPGSSFPVKKKIGSSILSKEDKDIARMLWLSGASFIEIENKVGINKAIYLCNKYYGFTIPWVLNAIARKFEKTGDTSSTNFYETLAVLVELGLPTLASAKTFLAGFKSRKVSVEISNFLDSSILEKSPKYILDFIVKNISSEDERLSPESKKWIDLLRSVHTETQNRFLSFPDFRIDNIKVNSTRLIPRMYKNKYYLCSPDYTEKILISSTDQFPFDRVSNLPGVCFQLGSNETWTIDYLD